ncbi:hypothetical protein MTO96_022945 [Rhipicephalus appendiculatus]
MQGFGSTPVSPGPKPPSSGTGGIAAGLLSARGPLSAAQARTHFDMVRKKWRKEGYSVVGTVSFAVLIVAFILLLVVLSRMVRTKRVAQSGCDTAVCRRYAAALNFSHQEHADPCFSFYQYVCGKWVQRRFDSVLDGLLETFQRVVTGMAMRAQAPAQFQNPSQRAARAYTSCISVLDRKEREEVRENKEDGEPRPLVSSHGRFRNPAGGRVAPDNHARDRVVGLRRFPLPQHLMNFLPPHMMKQMERHGAWQMASNYAAHAREFARGSFALSSHSGR